MIGTELRSELDRGTLASCRHALLVAAAAVGGSVAPVLIHRITLAGAPSHAGVGIAVATDVVLALSVLALAGDRAPVSLRGFVCALALLETVVAFSVVAYFAPSGLRLEYVFAAAGCLALTIILQVRGVTAFSPYLLLGAAAGVCSWLAHLHVALAGMLLGAALPRQLWRSTDPRARRFHHSAPPNTRWHAPLALVFWVAGAIWVALLSANTRLRLEHATLDAQTLRLSAAFGLALGIGKPLGTLGAAWLALKARLGALPAGLGFRELAWAAWLSALSVPSASLLARLALPDVHGFGAAQIGLSVVGAAGLMLASTQYARPR